jgi:hypothetical protein
MKRSLRMLPMQKDRRRQNLLQPRPLTARQLSLERANLLMVHLPFQKLHQLPLRTKLHDENNKRLHARKSGEEIEKTRTQNEFVVISRLVPNASWLQTRPI